METSLYASNFQCSFPQLQECTKVGGRDDDDDDEQREKKRKNKDTKNEEEMMMNRQGIKK
jgi:hypothetical protein